MRQGILDVVVLEDWRLVTVLTSSGWYTVALLDDGLVVIESVDVAVTPAR